MSNTAPHASVRHSTFKKPLATRIHAIELEATMLCVGRREVNRRYESGPGETMPSPCETADSDMQKGTCISRLLHCFLSDLVTVCQCSNNQSPMATNSRLLLGVLYTLLSNYAIAQTTTALPPAQIYANGQFHSPDTAKTQVFTIGSTMTISWGTVFKSVDIYLVSGQTTVMGTLQSRELFGRCF
jgi:hypothetical protein